MSYLGDLFFTWINKFRKKISEPIYEVDWQLIEITDPDSDPISGIEILTGQFKGLVYNYTYVKVFEDPAQQSATVKFGYNVVSSLTTAVEDMNRREKDALEFLMWQILQQLIYDKQELAEYVFPQDHYSEQIKNAET